MTVSPWGICLRPRPCCVQRGNWLTGPRAARLPCLGALERSRWWRGMRVGALALWAGVHAPVYATISWTICKRTRSGSAVAPATRMSLVGCVRAAPDSRDHLETGVGRAGVRRVCVVCLGGRAGCAGLRAVARRWRRAGGGARAGAEGRAGEGLRVCGYLLYRLFIVWL